VRSAQELGVIAREVSDAERSHRVVVAAQDRRSRPGERLDRRDDRDEHDDLHADGTCSRRTP